MDLTHQEQSLLLELSKQSIDYGVVYGKPMELDSSIYSKRLRREQATFVTIELNNSLRGCIGQLRPIQPLVNDIVANSFSAAFKDPRFSAVTKNEAKNLNITLSLLNEPKELDFEGKENLFQRINIGSDGVIINDLGKTGVFLPVVWEMFPDPEEFFKKLKEKAGIPSNKWSSTLKVLTFSVDIIK